MKVLVVDDQALNRNLLKHMLLHEGFDVVLAENGRIAVDVCKAEKPDMVLLDVVMPEMDGYETAPLLKELSTEVYLPIIFITALGDQDSLKRCLEVGGDDFLSKPFDRVILQAKINAHSRIRALSIKSFEQKKQLDFFRLKTEREHQIVEHIFNRALKGNYKAPHLLDYHLSPASMFNGDIMLAGLGPTGNFYLMMGDFTGHGLAAAVGTLPVSATFYKTTQIGLAVGEIAKEINRSLLTLLPNDMFCAACIVELNSSGKSLSIWAGGTPDMYIIDDNDGIRQTITAQHMALGILEQDEFDLSVENFSVNDSDRLFIATDGVVESFDESGQMFGDERLLHMLNDPNKNSVNALVDALTEFRGNGEQDDDISIVNIRCNKVNSDVENGRQQYSLIPHKYEVELTPDAIKNSDPCSEIVSFISQLQGAELHRSTLFLLLTEGYNNAVDHGLLELDSALKDSEDGFINYYMQRSEKLEQLHKGSVHIKLEYDPTDVTIYMEISDTGIGFDITTLDIEKDQNKQHGRGTMLMQELATNIDYNEKGNLVKIAYCLDEGI